MGMKKIFIYQNDQQDGPLEFNDIRVMAHAGKIGAEALMWFEGMADWAPAEQVLAQLGITARKAPSASLPPTPVSAPAPSAFSGSFKIRYNPALVSSTGLNGFWLSGVGEIVFAADGIHLRGTQKRPFRFSKKVDICIQPEQLVNLVRDGKLLRFGIVSPPDKDKVMQIWAENESAAEKIQQVLPSNHTPKFAAIQAEAADFQTRLAAVGGAPWFTNALVAINVLVFVACALNGGGVLKPDALVMMQWGTNYGPLTMSGQWWRLFTSMFLHFGILHLALNMWALYTGGRLVERLYGSASFLLLYLGAGLCGSLASVLWHPAGNSAGASGAIMGVYGAMLAFFLRKDTLVPASVIAQQRNGILAFAGYNLIYGMSHPGIDNAAHIGGFLGGFLLGLAMIRPLDVEQRTASGIRHWARGAAAAFALVVSLGYAVTHPGTARKQELQIRSDINWLGKQEAAAGKALNDGLQKFKAGTISSSQFADLLEHDVIPRWDEMQQRITNDQLPGASKLQTARTALIDYCDNRQESLKLLDKYLHSGDEDALKQSNAKAEQAKNEVKNFTEAYKKAQ